jgi:hypothetical protein
MVSSGAVSDAPKFLDNSLDIANRSQKEAWSFPNGVQLYPSKQTFALKRANPLNPS